jgi:hypothetical protein
MNYHDAIIDLVNYILRNGESYLRLIDSGNAFDKTLRNYHQFNLNGDKVYRKASKMSLHYRYSENAWKSKNQLDDLYFEHLVPLKITKEKLLDLIKTNKVSHESVKAILDENEIVVITRIEQKIVDAPENFKSSLPEGDIDRLSAVGIKIAEETKNNSLF